MSWDTRELSEVATIRSGGTPSKANADYWGGDYPWITAKDLKSFRLSTSKDGLSLEGRTKAAKTTPKGSVLVLVRGMTLMRSLPVGVTSREVAFNQDIKALFPNKEKINAEYLGYFLVHNSERIRAFVTQAGHGTGVLPLDCLASFPIKLPPLDLQLEIASKLTSCDRAIELQKKLIELLGVRLTELVAEKTWRSISDKWEEVELGDILEHVFRPVEWRATDHFDLINVRRRCAGIALRMRVLGSEYKTRDLHTLQSGDFVLSKRQASHGAMAMVREDFDGSHVSKEYTILVNRDADRLYMPFLDWLSRNPRFWWHAFVSSNGVVKEKLILSPKDFLRTKVSIPSTVECQKGIVGALECFQQEFDLQGQRLALLEDQKRGAMQELMS